MIRGTLEHPKFLDLQSRLARPRTTVAGVLECLWHFTAKYAPGGDVGRWPNEAIARALEWDGSADELVAALVGAGWLDRDPEHRLYVHDWHEHADDALHMMMARATRYFAHGERPRLRRFAAEERKIVEARYAAKESDPCARQAHGVRTSLPLPALPLQREETPEPAAPDASRLLSLLSGMKGSREEKALWLAEELPIMLADADGELSAVRRLVPRYWRQYLKRGEREHRATLDRRQREAERVAQRAQRDRERTELDAMTPAQIEERKRRVDEIWAQHTQRLRAPPETGPLFPVVAVRAKARASP